MHLLLFPLLLVPLFVTAMLVFVVGAILLRVLFFVAIAALAGAFLFGSGLLRGAFRACGSGPRRYYWRCPNRRFDEPPPDLGNSAFDDYRRATLSKLEDEAREFRTFLAKLRQAADAADFQAFLNSRRASGS
jgi:hypothetical protein